jgi:hypothetical protein
MPLPNQQEEEKTASQPTLSTGRTFAALKVFNKEQVQNPRSYGLTE